MEALFANMTLILAVIGILAFCVSVITQVIKNVGFLSKIPTDALVLVLSIGITVAAYAVYPHDNLVVYDFSSYHGWVYCGVYFHVRMGENYGIVETNVQG